VDLTSVKRNHIDEEQLLTRSTLMHAADVRLQQETTKRSKRPRAGGEVELRRFIGNSPQSTIFHLPFFETREYSRADHLQTTTRNFFLKYKDNLTKCLYAFYLPFNNTSWCLHVPLPSMLRMQPQLVQTTEQ
jgi:hypothetical protein